MSKNQSGPLTPDSLLLADEAQKEAAEKLAAEVVVETTPGLRSVAGTVQGGIVSFSCSRGVTVSQS